METGEDATVLAYEQAASAYLAAHRPPSAALLGWIERFAMLLHPGAVVLEVGSGPGTDALLLEERGLRVLRSDATRTFAERLRAQSREVLDLDVRSDPIPRAPAGTAPQRARGCAVV